jgi:hypothetical protein
MPKKKTASASASAFASADNNNIKTTTPVTTHKTGITVETVVAPTYDKPTSRVQSPMVQMTQGFGNMKSRVRPTKIRHEMFGVVGTDLEAVAENVNEFGNNSIEKFVASIAETVDDVDDATVTALINEMDNYNDSDGYINYDQDGDYFYR